MSVDFEECRPDRCVQHHHPAEKVLIHSTFEVLSGVKMHPVSRSGIPQQSDELQLLLQGKLHVGIPAGPLAIVSNVQITMFNLEHLLLQHGSFLLGIAPAFVKGRTIHACTRYSMFPALFYLQADSVHPPSTFLGCILELLFLSPERCAAAAATSPVICIMHDAELGLKASHGAFARP
jgi:hypothetical protein